MSRSCLSVPSSLLHSALEFSPGDPGGEDVSRPHLVRMADGAPRRVAGQAEAPLQGALGGELLAEALHAAQGCGRLPPPAAGGGGDALAVADSLPSGGGEEARGEVRQPAPQALLTAPGVA